VLAKQATQHERYAMLLVVGTTIVAEGRVETRMSALDGSHAAEAAEVERLKSKKLAADERRVGDGTEDCM
jgi:hypothetical protein